MFHSIFFKYLAPDSAPKHLAHLTIFCLSLQDIFPTLYCLCNILIKLKLPTQRLIFYHTDLPNQVSHDKFAGGLLPVAEYVV